MNEDQARRTFDKLVKPWKSNYAKGNKRQRRKHRAIEAAKYFETKEGKLALNRVQKAVEMMTILWPGVFEEVDRQLSQDLPDEVYAAGGIYELRAKE